MIGSTKFCCFLLNQVSDISESKEELHNIVFGIVEDEFREDMEALKQKKGSNHKCSKEINMEFFRTRQTHRFL